MRYQARQSYLSIALSWHFRTVEVLSPASIVMAKHNMALVRMDHLGRLVMVKHNMALVTIKKKLWQEHGSIMFRNYQNHLSTLVGFSVYFEMCTSMHTYDS